MGRLTEDEAAAILRLHEAPGMTVATLIEALQEIEREHGGDLPVLMHDDARVREVYAYDKDGNLRDERIEVMLHGVR